MTATDELRRLLDERGVEWDELVGHPVVVGTEWHDRDGCPCTALEHADDLPDGMLSVQANLTPEQAIEATLGRGECHDKNGRNRLMGFECTVCDVMCSDCDMHDPSEGFVHFRYCPSCGRKVRA